eukprot:TRINITY_DN48_c0_g1_i3.p1 TRINITY_DN48_c0_g1~~TRINITY_DN48_c0_g1_i3.p1  ORF type:complete len:299 (-),score=60.68 TRINITY_DN48_c0_g1_i3:73-969(-)
MPFTKIIKNKAYFKRFQVKYRRRREGKTDYYARRRLIIQDKNKYNTPKYRLVVRFTNRDIIAQIIYAKIQGDAVLSVAYSHELPRYGIKLGLTNYAAAYATGLLIARRVLDQLKIADQFPGVVKPTGDWKPFKQDPSARRPFKALLDVGMARTTTGAKIFAVLKGASDGGLHIPHSNKRFVGYETEKNKYDPKVLRKYIFGGHVADWMKEMKEDDPEKFKTQFSRYIKENITPDTLEKIYTDAHAAIRKSPQLVKTKKPENPVHRKYNLPKLTPAQRRERVIAKLEALANQLDSEIPK